MQVRWATAADIKQFRPDTRETIRARVAVDGDEVVGIAGYFVRHGMAHVVSEIRGDLPKQLIWREAVAMMKRINLPAVCLADPAIAGSCRFLERLGWRHVETTEQGEVYSWRV